MDSIILSFSIFNLQFSMQAQLAGLAPRPRAEAGWLKFYKEMDSIILNFSIFIFQISMQAQLA
jgi:hypothetical protein